MVEGALGWLTAEALDDDARKRLRAYLRERRPIGVVGQGERQFEFYARLTVSSAGAFAPPGHEPWGVLESAEHGAVIVAPEVVVWSGGVGSRADFSAIATRTARRCSQPFARRRTRFIRSRLGAESSLMGAAAAALESSSRRTRT